MLAITKILLIAVAGTLADFPDGKRPGDQLMGTGPEFFRYRSVFVRPPNDSDRAESLRRSQFVLCEVCREISARLILQMNLQDEDAILDVLEGRDNRGCQRHFKDSLMALGWGLISGATCPGKEFCLHKGDPRDLDDMDTYTVSNDALFYACEQTIGANIDAVASFVYSTTKRGKINPLALALAACRDAAKCARVPDQRRSDL